jgi:hypothetical protein
LAAVECLARRPGGWPLRAVLKLPLLGFRHPAFAVSERRTMRFRSHAHHLHHEFSAENHPILIGQIW